MFDILNEIINIQTNKLQEVPTRLEKDRLKECVAAGGAGAACERALARPLAHPAAAVPSPAIVTPAWHAQLCTTGRAL